MNTHTALGSVVKLDESVLERRHPAVCDFLIVEKSIDMERRSARFVASTETMDGHGEVVKQNWQLDRFLSNPVVLYNHQRFGSDLPIGTASVEMRNGVLECEITFCTEKASPLVEYVWNSVKERVLRAVSVGFKPHTVRFEMLSDQEVCVLDDNELFEISVTPIGSNPDALAKAKALARNAAAAPPANEPHAARAPETEMEINVKDYEQRGIDLKAATERADATQKALDAMTKERDTVTAARDEVTKKLDTSVKALETELVPARAALVQLTELDEVLTKAGRRVAVPAPEGTAQAPAVLSTKARVEELIDENISHEVEAQVGIKLTPAEKPEYVELRKLNKPLYERMLAGKPVMALAGKTMGKDPNPRPNPVATANGGDELGELLDKSVTEATSGTPDLGSMM